jgi:hypothetical protein
MATQLNPAPGQAQDQGLMMESTGAGRGGERITPMTPRDDEQFKGAHGRVVVSW